MCGIWGKLNFDPENPVNTGLLHRMAEVQHHRGPDDEGIYIDGSMGLGHKRLAIIDLSPAGRQPMPNEDGTIWITFNGEVYNFLDLRKGLIGRGHSFRSQTDTEVILHLYEEHGSNCLQFLRGMFAFAIWDARSRILFLARDRLGKKPLFYFMDHGKFLFASEPKAILEDPDVRAEPDVEAIHHYLTYGYVPSPFSAFKGIKKLPPAHFLWLQDGSIRIERYWRLSYLKQQTVGRSEEELCQELLERVREAVRLRMISDVPLGAFLSGGIDSSIVVALMSEISSHPVKTFSIGFEEEAYNEIPYARIVADRFRTDHHEFVVKPDAIGVIPKLVWHYSEPFADSSAIPTYYLASMTREHVTVALNGDGGDENFAGYDRYVANRMARSYDRLPLPVRTCLERGTALLLQSSPSGSLRSRAKRFFEAIASEPRRRYSRWMSHFNGYKKRELYTEAFREAVGGIDSVELLLQAYEASDATDFIDATLHVDVQMYLPDDLLVKADIASMAHSLEARSPLIDHRVMEFAASLPSDLKLYGKTQKYIFKKAVKGLLPDAIIHRPKKGFGVPIDRWFRKELREMAYDVLLNRRCLERGYFSGKAVQRLLDEHCRGSADCHYLLWNLLMLELWHRTFVDASCLRPERVSGSPCPVPRWDGRIPAP